ncbi:MAG: T9SS type A sorting domain-containing protein [Calditrichales bacterium]|nr:MAG: T9SS type A sorting domain-containing protein [Calditrichales bacterium]
MKTGSMLLTFIFIFSLVFIAPAQVSYFGIGDANVYVKPEPAQGNSAGIEFYPVAKEFVENASMEYTISYDSDLNKVITARHGLTTPEIMFLSTGTEIIDFEQLNNKNENPEILASEFYYSMILESRVSGYAWYLNYDWTNFQERLTTLGNQGYRIENLDTYGHSVYNYAGTWTQDGLGWSWVLNYTNMTSFINILNGWPNGIPRYRPIDFALHPSGSQLTYGAVAVSDNLGFGWILNETSQSAFLTWITTQYNAGRRIVEIEMYTDGLGNQMYAGISEAAGYAQQVAINMSLSQFQTQNTQWINSGYRLIDFDKYAVGSSIFYASVWINDGVGYAWSVDYLNLTTFQNLVTGHINNGFKPIVLDVYDNEVTSPVMEDADNQPTRFSLRQNYPNPFNPSTQIDFQLAKSEFVTLKVFNVLGEEIATLLSASLPSGSHSYEWDASGQTSGVYYYQLIAGDFSEVKKMILLR